MLMQRAKTISYQLGIGVIIVWFLLVIGMAASDISEGRFGIETFVLRTIVAGLFILLPGVLLYGWGKR